MKAESILLLITFLCLALTACSDDTSPTEGITIVVDGSQVAVAWGYIISNYLIGDTVITDTSYRLSGELYAPVMPSFDHFSVGSRRYALSKYHSYKPGYIAFDNFQNPAIAETDTLSLEVSTSIGLVQGFCNFPGKIESFRIVDGNNNQLSYGDTIMVGQPLNVSWSVSEARMFHLQGSYEWYSLSRGFQTTDIDVIVEDTSISFDGTFFASDGEVLFEFIRPMNGPFPRENELGNVSGDGEGYLYCMDSGRYVTLKIIVGTGTPTIGKRSDGRSSEKHSMERTEEKIRSMLGLI